LERNNIDIIEQSLMHLYEERQAFTEVFFKNLEEASPALHMLAPRGRRRRETILFAGMSMMVKAMRKPDGLMAPVFGLAMKRARKKAADKMKKEEFTLISRVFIDTVTDFVPADQRDDLYRAWKTVYDQTFEKAFTISEPAPRPA
jgi:hemoglobin-like flavoprotein